MFLKDRIDWYSQLRIKTFQKWGNYCRTSNNTYKSATIYLLLYKFKNNLKEEHKRESSIV